MLDEAIARLGTVDRTAVVLRFLERRSLAEVGQSLGVSEQAAQMRVSRAVEKLRGFFRRRGVVVTATVVGVLFTAHSTQAAPETLTASLDPGVLDRARRVPYAPSRRRSSASAWARRTASWTDGRRPRIRPPATFPAGRRR